MALALSSSVEDVVHVLDSIRYRGRPDYAGRNHLMEAEWLPSNASKGMVRDVTAQLGGDGVVVQDAKVIGAAAWASRTARALALPSEGRLTGRFPLSVLPVDQVAAHAARWPSGTLLLVVREDAPANHPRQPPRVHRPAERAHLPPARDPRLEGRVVDEEPHTCSPATLATPGGFRRVALGDPRPASRRRRVSSTTR